MATRTALTAAMALALAPWPAAAQIQAPTPVDETEPAAPEVPDPRAPTRRPVPPARLAPAAARDPAPEPGPPPDPSAAGVPDTLPAPAPRPPSPAPAPPAARAIEPVGTTPARLQEAWAERRAALREQDPARAASAAAAILDVKRRLAIDDLTALAASEARDAVRTLESNLPTEALGHAEMAIKLAPDLADSHLALARARLAKSPGDPLPALAALRDAAAAALREPHSQRAFYGDLLTALLAALVTASAATLVLLLLRSVRLFLHDFHHLPLLRGSAGIQAAFLGLVLLAAPLAFGLGPFLVLAIALAASWLYLRLGERLVGTLSLLILAGLPWAAEWTARTTAWTGTPAEVVYELEHGLVDEGQVADLVASAGPTPSPALAAALGRHFKRRGDLEAALGWYARASHADERAAEILVNVGNVRFLQGELEAAKAAYLQASDKAGGDLTVQAAAHYNLSKVYLRGSDIGKSSAARDRAEQEDGAFLRQYGADDDFTANRYLVDVPVPAARIRALAVEDGAPAEVREAVLVRLAGALPRVVWPWAPLGLLAALWVLAAAAPALGASHHCEKCGRPACQRCDPAGGPLCGQCVNVYVKKGLVDARDRLRKDAEVRRHQQLGQLVRRTLAVVGGGAGHVVHGLAGRGFASLTALLFAAYLLWFWRGVMPPPQPTPYLLLGKLAVVLPFGLAVYVIAVRDLFRRTQS